MTDAEKEQMGLSRSLVRLCFGLEDPDDLWRDLRDAFASIDTGRSPMSEESSRAAE
jgi:cystathionine gamma-lyase/homocysteine desulfhydrase